MQLNAPLRFMDTIKASLSASNLIDILNAAPNQAIFIKGAHSNYYYGNDVFLGIMGIKNPDELTRLTDFDLSKNRQEAYKYQELDSFVLEENKTLTVCEQVSPLYNQTISQKMKGKLYPLLAKNGRPNYVLGVVSPESKLLKLDWDTVFKLTMNELDTLLSKSSYPIKLNVGFVMLSKMEIKILVQLLRGSTASDIAHALQIQQATVTSYFTNINNKLAVNDKRELINLVIGEKILHKIML